LHRACLLVTSISRVLADSCSSPCFFFNHAATTEIYTLSLHDALPICSARTPRISRTASRCCRTATRCVAYRSAWVSAAPRSVWRSEEHTSELQSHLNLVCRLLLEKKKKKKHQRTYNYSTSTRATYNNK